MGLDAVEDHARRVEALGYDGLCVPDAVHDGLLLCHAALRVTARLHTATSVLVAFPRSPMLVAIAAWDLAAASGGRFELGLGTQVRGNIERRYSTPWTAPVARMREYVLRAARDLALVPDRRAARLRGRALPVHAPPAVLQPGPDRAPGDPDLPGRGRAEDDRARGRGRRRHDDPPHEQRAALPARGDAARARGGRRARRARRAPARAARGRTRSPRAATPPRSRASASTRASCSPSSTPRPPTGPRSSCSAGARSASACTGSRARGSGARWRARSATRCSTRSCRPRPTREIAAVVRDVVRRPRHAHQLPAARRSRRRRARRARDRGAG